MQPLYEDRSGKDERPPRAAWLAAYLDGELTSEDVARVEAWLAEDAEARAELESQRCLRDLFAEVEIPEPLPEQWRNTLAGIDSALEKRRRAGHFFRHLGWIAAAAILLALSPINYQIPELPVPSG